jgi:hypothetical protein
MAGKGPRAALCFTQCLRSLEGYVKAKGQRGQATPRGVEVAMESEVRG